MKHGPSSALLFYCGSLFEWHVFRRFRSALKQYDLSLVTVTHRLSVWLHARLSGIPCLLLRPATSDQPHDGCDPAESLEVKRGLIDQGHAQEFQNAVWNALDEAKRRYAIKGVCMWNGTPLYCTAAGAYARANGLPTLYLELGNIGGNLFADPEGTNAAAHVASHPEILDGLPVSDEEIAAWRSQFLETRAKVVELPQARIARLVNGWFAVDSLGHALLRVPRRERLGLYEKVVEKFRSRSVCMPPAVEPTVPYVFFALQVSADSNLIVHSDYDNLKALDVAERRARQRGCLLVVKPHPAEIDDVLLKKIADLCAMRGHLMTSANVTKLVQNAVEVVTINSTVGLEALLLDKPLTVLGRSIYGRFSRRQAYSFVIKHMVRMRVFATEDASAAAIGRLLELLGTRSL